MYVQLLYMPKCFLTLKAKLPPFEVPVNWFINYPKGFEFEKIVNLPLAHAHTM
jgi:hypothetical protein